jgi:hypothetical protein
MRLLSALVVSLATTSVAAARATTNPHHKMSNNQQAHVDSIPGGMKSVKPGMMSFDDHHFKINYDVPEEVTEELLDLMHRNAKYEEVPKEYLKYEVEKPREPDMLKDTHAKEKGMGL